MTNIVIPINNLDYTVNRPVVFDVIRQVMNITEISSKTPIRIGGEDLKGMQKNTAIDEDKTEWNKFSHDESVLIEVLEEFDLDRINSTTVKNVDNILIFDDITTGTIIKPVYGINKVTITFKYKASDKNKANTWRNDIKTKTSMGRDINLHELNYSYTLPTECIVILKQIHTLRESQAGYLEDFDNYFSKNITNRASTVSNLDGTKYDWNISEKQIRVQGLFDFQSSPDKPEKYEESNAYETIFTYSFTYDKPIHVNMVYPLVIHNKLIPKRFRFNDAPYTFDHKEMSFSLTAQAFNHFEDSKDILNYYGNKGLDIPSFDNGFNPNSITSGSARVFSVLTLINSTDKKSLFNLNDLGDFNLNPEVIEFIKQERNYIPNPYSSIFTIHLYCNNRICEDVKLIIDNDLNVVSSVDLDLRKVYRVRLGVIINIDLLNKTTTDRIKSYNILNPNFGKRLVYSINSILKDLGKQSDIKTSYLTRDDLIKLGIIPSNYNMSINPTDNIYYDPNMINKKSVQLLFIQTHRSN